jgi:hypothetical protein
MYEEECMMISVSKGTRSKQQNIGDPIWETPYFPEYGLGNASCNK